MNIAVILAGGSGNRFGADKPKQFVEVAGKTILEHSVMAFANHPQIDEVCVVSREDWVPFVQELLAGIEKVKRVVAGGKERYHSTLAALDCYEADEDVLLFHDAVRPLITAETITRCVEQMREHKACAVGVPCTDTIWCSIEGRIDSIPDRKRLFNAQTPQCFKRGVIRTAYDLALKDPMFVSSDDCGVVVRYLPETHIHIVTGEPTNIKITYPSDLMMAEKILSNTY